MSHSSFGSSSIVKLALAGLLAWSGSACAMAADDTGKEGNAVTSQGAACDVAAAPTPEGWTLHAMPTFSVAAPADGMIVSQTSEAMVRFFTPTAELSLTAFARSDLVTLESGAGAWKEALGEHCTMTLEPTRHQCDGALRLHATCAAGRTSEVLLVLRHGVTYSASCELNTGADAATCARFLETLRIE